MLPALFKTLFLVAFSPTGAASPTPPSLYPIIEHRVARGRSFH